MIKKLKVYRDNYDDPYPLIFDLYNPAPNGLNVTNITGIGGYESSYTSSSSLLMDGSIYGSTYLNERNIVIYISYINDLISVEKARNDYIYQYFGHNRKLLLVFEREGEDRGIFGYVEKVDTDVFQKTVTTAISIKCPNPYFETRDISTHTENTVIKMFEFPWSNETPTLDPIEKNTKFGEINNFNGAMIIDNIGSTIDSLKITWDNTILDPPTATLPIGSDQHLICTMQNLTYTADNYVQEILCSIIIDMTLYFDEIESGIRGLVYPQMLILNTSPNDMSCVGYMSKYGTYTNGNGLAFVNEPIYEPDGSRRVDNMSSHISRYTGFFLRNGRNYLRGSSITLPNDPIPINWSQTEVIEYSTKYYGV